MLTILQVQVKVSSRRWDGGGVPRQVSVAAALRTQEAQEEVQVAQVVFPAAAEARRLQGLDADQGRGGRPGRGAAVPALDRHGAEAAALQGL